MSGANSIRLGDQVQVHLKAEKSGQEGWFGGVVHIDQYSAHRSFHWVQLDAESQAILSGAYEI